MIDLDLIRDLCGSLPPFPDGCEVTGASDDGSTVYAESPSGIKMMATLVRGKVPRWTVWRFPGTCRSENVTCSRGASNAPEAGCNRV